MKTTVALPLQLLLLITIWPLLSSSASTEMAKKRCESKCGNVSVPFPFGIGPSSNCYLNESFRIICNESYTPPRPFIMNDFLVYNLSLNGHIRVDGWMAWECNNNFENARATVGLPFAFSASLTKFTAIGCDTEALITVHEGRHYTSGCISVCDSENSVINGSCTGIGCCQTSIPKGVRDFQLRLKSLNNHKKVGSFNPCSYAFLVEQDMFNFSADYLRRDNFTDMTTFPMVLDWAVGNSTCEQAQADGSRVCGGNSTCHDSENGPGYLCSCLEGFRGNPYLEDGCQDIDECKERSPCNKSQLCTNTLGSYNCTCRPGTHNNNESEVQICIRDGSPKFIALQVALGVSLCFLLLLLSSSWLYCGLKQRRFIKLKEKFFEANGGLLLQRQLLTQSGSTNEATQIFTEEEIKRATDNYSDSRIIGRGGCGIVYKGILPNNRLVAIKKSKLDDGVRQTAQFINEITILLQVNHRNVVKLLGCCLEVQVPLLVYEFVPNGTLFQHIHEESQASSISWNNRLRIAAEAAGALAYLHSSASIPILHGDVKSANILLDNNYTAKVSDFGTSKLVPLDHNQITTLVQGTLGYLDPEYFQTSHLTDKSDVYSFGVVLVELLSAQMPISFECTHEERNLSMRFISSMKQNRLEEMLEARVLDEATKEQVEIVAQLAWRCLEVKGVERPSMKEVAAELDGLLGFGDHPWMEDTQEAQHLLGDMPSSSNTQMEGIESIQRDVMLSLEMGR